jgi:hypothetical protein
MPSLLVQIERFVDEHQPGFVECSLIDATGKKHSFVEKIPVVTTENLWSNSPYPRPGLRACQIEQEVQITNGEAIVQVSTELPWHIESTTGETKFVVHPYQIENQRAV